MLGDVDKGTFCDSWLRHSDRISADSGYFSWRHTVAGSWFIQALCKVFEESVLTTHVLDMLVKVRGRRFCNGKKGNIRGGSELVARLGEG